MKAVSDHHNFAAREEEILQLWKKLDAFKESVKKNQNKPLYTFYDGPPFATGLPHYGNHLAGFIKDTVTRYAHQNGHNVERRFGWDCHGLPIEFEIDKKYNIKTRDDVLKWGIANYNEACRSIVLTYSEEWRDIVTRMGRWIDFDNDYKTMDTSFMETVWWVFKELYRKDLVYLGFKVMPYSTSCTTPLSNFEANLNYKDTSDPEVVVSFPLVNDPSTAFLAWTTTPWTLPSNLALCVNPQSKYVIVREKKSGQKYILMESRLPVLEPTKQEYVILNRMLGKELEGLQYKPLFTYFQEDYKSRGFRVLCDTYVTEESGTGIVHQAPGFGEDDYRICLREGIIEKTVLPCPIDANGRFTLPVSDFVGKYIKEADKLIIQYLKDSGRLIHRGELVHSYPFCWRSDTPLIYRAVPSWFVKVEQIKEKLLSNNNTTYWVPAFVKEKRFHNWLEDARDWAISRNRYWGTPIPVWMSEDGEEIVVVGSAAELTELTGAKVTDLHSHFIDSLTIPSKKGKGVLRRIPEVFDCWFESGSMPYAQVHYPFENKEKFEKGFPADFIAEGLDQTRGWFYTLLVISTALFEKPAFKNLIVNGLVLAEDGKKMSKRLKNYPDPAKLVKEFGADAIRLYMINSPVVRGENLKFQAKGVSAIIKDVFLRWHNGYRLFVQNIHRLEEEGRKFTPCNPTVSNNIMDKWELSSLQSLIKFVHQEMGAYHLYTVVPVLVKFVTSLANWFIRLNRSRLKGNKGPKEEEHSLNTLYYVLITLCKAMAPFTPFLTEDMYQNLRHLEPESSREDCVHYLPYPTPREDLCFLDIERSVGRMQDVIELARLARDRKKLKFKFPVLEIIVYQKDQKYLDDIKLLESYILKEVNVKKLTLRNEDGEGVIRFKALPNNKKLGQRLKKEMDKVCAALEKLTSTQLEVFEKTGTIVVEGHTLSGDELSLVREFSGNAKQYEAAWSTDVLVVLDITQNPQLIEEGQVAEIQNRIQRLRKTAKLTPSQRVGIYYSVSGNNKRLVKVMEEVIVKNRAVIEEKTNVSLTPDDGKELIVSFQVTSKVDEVDLNLKLINKN